jgi:uncharacterized coiled-coil protein SlyX
LRVKLAVREPVVEGVNVMLTEQAPAAGKVLAEQVSALTAKSDALAPLRLTAPKVMLAPLTLVTVTLCGALVTVTG